MEAWTSNPKSREQADQFLKNINIQLNKGDATTPQPNDNHSETDATLTNKTSNKNTHEHMKGQQTVPTNSPSPAPTVITEPAQPHPMMQSRAQQQHASPVNNPKTTEPQTGPLAPAAPSPEVTPKKTPTPPTETKNLQPTNDTNKEGQTQRPTKRARKEKANKPYPTLPQIAETEDEHWASNDLSKAAIVKLTKDLNNPCSSEADIAAVLKHLRHVAHTQRAENDVAQRRATAHALTVAVARAPNNDSIRVVIEALIMLLLYGYSVKKVHNAVLAAHKCIMASKPSASRIALQFAAVRQRVLETYGTTCDEKAIELLDEWATDMQARTAKFDGLDNSKLLHDLERIRHRTDTPGTPHNPDATTIQARTWRASALPSSKIRPETIKYASWNVNGFNNRFESGELTQFINAHRPDVLCLTETRLGAGGVRDPWTTQQTLTNMGYSHIVWHGNVNKPQDHGIMVATKLNAVAITVGTGNAVVDTEGRVITIEFDDHTAVLCYAPCTKFGENGHSPKRDNWTKAITAHIQRHLASKPTFLQGDLNIAPTPRDCTATFPVQPMTKPEDIVTLPGIGAVMRPGTIPSTTARERQLHESMLQSTGLTDAILHFKGANQPVPITWARKIDLFRRNEGLRIDHTLAPQALLDLNKLPLMADAHVGNECHGSDHAATFATIVRSADALKKAKATATLRHSSKDTSNIVALAGNVAYATTPARRRVATSAVKQHIGDFLPPMPDMSNSAEQSADILFLTLAKLCLAVDELPPTPPKTARSLQRLNGGNSDSEHRECCEDEDNDTIMATTDPHSRDTHIIAAIEENSEQPIQSIAEDKELPQVVLNIPSKQLLITALIDTGAAYSILDEQFARKNRIRIRPMDKDDKLHFRMANGIRCRPRGTVDLTLDIRGHNIEGTFYVLPNCPYNALIGSDFNENHGGIVNYRSSTWTIRDGNDDVTVDFHTVKRKPTALTVTPATDGHITIKPRSVQRIPVVVHTEGSNIGQHDIDSGNVFGLFTGTKTRQFVVNNGVGNAASTNTHNFVVVTNTSPSPIRLFKTTVVAMFSPDSIDTDSLDPSQQNADSNETDPVTAALHTDCEPPELSSTRADEVKLLSEADIDTAIAASQWLKDLDLTDVTKNLSPAGVRRVKELVLTYESLWDERPKPPPPTTHSCTIKIKSTPKLNGNMPQINPSVRAELARIINDMLDRGIIEPGTGPYSSTVLLLPKPKGGLRFVLDYRALNSCIEADAYTLPQVEEVLSTLHGSTLFSAIDIKEAFWSVPLDKESKQLTGFRTPIGLFQYTRMPMGLKTASAVFCRFLDSIVGDLRWSVALTYIDDVLIYTKNENDHLQALETLFKRLQQANLTLKASKTSLATTSVAFLGNIVDKDGHHPDPAKVKAITAIELPQTAKKLQSTLGNFGYYRKFIKNYATKTHPLREKMASKWRKDKDGKAIWTDAERNAFFSIRDILSTEPVLAHPNWSLPFEVHTDASQEGLGAVLVQRINGREHAIMYASRAVTAIEQPFAIWELEALAVVWACRLFRMYLYGSKFKIVTDSQAVTTICKASYKAAGGRLARWSMALNDFDYELVHREGSRNAGPDLLSRNPLPHETPYGEEPTNLDPHPLLAVSSVANICTSDAYQPNNEQWDLQSPFTGKAPFYKGGDECPRTAEEWVTLQNLDETCIRIKANLEPTDPDHGSSSATSRPKEADEYRIDAAGLLLRRRGHTATRNITAGNADSNNDAWQIVTPVSCCAFIMYRYHTLPMSGHHGRDNTVRNIARHYYWRGMNKDIARWIRACAVCRKRKEYRRIHAGTASSVSTARHPHDTIAIDLVSTSGTHATGDKYILTCIDVFTRWVTAIPVKSKKTKDIADALFRHVFCIHGRPNYIRTDEGSEFVNNGLRYLYRRWGIKPISTGGYQPQALPVERFHRFLNAAMTTLAAKFGEDWTTYLPAVTFAYNSSVTATTGYSPFALTFGRNPQLLEDMEIILRPAADSNLSEQDYAVTLANRLQVAYNHVQEQQTRLIEASRVSRDSNYKSFEYKIGDSVLFWEPQQTRRLHKEGEDQIDAAESSMTDDNDKSDATTRGPAKWTPKWTGPHKIVEKSKPPTSRNYRYTFRHVERSENITTHPNRLCLFQPWADNTPSTSWDLDDHRPYVTGAWVKQGALVIVPLQDPYPFGVGKVLSAHTDGTLDIQWLGTNGDNTKPHRAALSLGWMPKTEFKPYYNAVKRNRAHREYRVADDNDAPFRQEDVILHSFELTAARKIPTPVQRAISEHPDVWWTMT